jgi:hypothetical protein
MLRDSEEKEDHLGDGATLRQLLEPVASIAGCKQYVLQVVAVLVARPETAYTESGKTLAELFLKLTNARDIKTWELDVMGLLRYWNAIYVLGDLVVKAKLL